MSKKYIPGQLGCHKSFFRQKPENQERSLMVVCITG